MKNIKSLILYIFLILTVSNCTVHFDKHYPNIINEFPYEFLGKYTIIEKHEHVQDTITMVITKDSITFPNDFLIKGGKLNSSTKLSKGKNFYHLNILQIENGKEVWDIYPLKISDKKLFIYIIDADIYKKYFNKKFKKAEGGDYIYIIDQKAFDKFCSKKLKKKSSLKFIKQN